MPCLEYWHLAPKVRMKKNIIHYLLIVCIGLGPAVAVNAADTGDNGLMSEHCISNMTMQTANHDSCHGDACFSAVGHCGSGFSVTILSAALINQGPSIARLIGHYSLDSRFRSHLVFSIFRPPIA